MDPRNGDSATFALATDQMYADGNIGDFIRNYLDI